MIHSYYDKNTFRISIKLFIHKSDILEHTIRYIFLLLKNKLNIIDLNMFTFIEL